MANGSAFALDPSHPSVVDPDHFAAGDRVMVSYGSVFRAADTRESIVVPGVETEAGRIALRGPHIVGGDVYQTSIANVFHAAGCDACDQYVAARQRADADQYQDQRSCFTPDGLARADALRRHGRTALSATNLPWLHTELSGVDFSGPEGPWPNWGRTGAPIDWPALIAAHPGDLAPEDTAALTESASWESIVEAFTLARSADPRAALDVCLWVDIDGTVLVEAAFLFTSRQIPTSAADAISHALVAGGRPRDLLHLDDDHVGEVWMLNN